MLLIELTLPSGIKRVSNEPLAIDHWWLPAVAAMGSARIAAAKQWGGMVIPTYGAIDLLPPVFDNDWPPPLSMPITVKFATAGEADAVTLFDGTSHRQQLKRDGVVYGLYGASYDTIVTDHHYLNPLQTVFANQCAVLGLTLDTAATTRDPAVDYQTSGDRILINDLSDIAAFFCHAFYIHDGVLYLVDMLADNGATTYTEYNFFPSAYTDPRPIGQLKAGAETLDGSASYGADLSISPVCHTASANIQAALADIKTLAERPTVELHKPLSEPPTIGERISWEDGSQHRPVTAWARATSVLWDFDQEFCVIEGPGEIT